MRLSTRFEDALVMAVRLHDGQIRKGSRVPYVSHLLAVSSLVLEHGGSEDQAIAALLHDAAEDAGGRPTLDRIRPVFGDAVAEIVDHCTDSYETPKPPWRPRKERYVAAIAQMPAAAALVSCADKLHNARTIAGELRDLGDDLWARFNGGRDGSLWYYAALAEAFRAHHPMPLAAELGRAVEAIHAAAGTDV